MTAFCLLYTYTHALPNKTSQEALGPSPAAFISLMTFSDTLKPSMPLGILHFTSANTTQEA